MIKKNKKTKRVYTSADWHSLEPTVKQWKKFDEQEDWRQVRDDEIMAGCDYGGEA